MGCQDSIAISLIVGGNLLRVTWHVGILGAYYVAVFAKLDLASGLGVGIAMVGLAFVIIQTADNSVMMNIAGSQFIATAATMTIQREQLDAVKEALNLREQAVQAAQPAVVNFALFNWPK